ncbi:hypothetical protein WSM22_37460 [Cytophagales bacterium WSM2-2]|nr:hypothetical protein WSM22_37460 [Cytophagales bacterium WSM2-2]
MRPCLFLFLLLLSSSVFSQSSPDQKKKDSLTIARLRQDSIKSRKLFDHLTSTGVDTTFKDTLRAFRGEVKKMEATLLKLNELYRKTYNRLDTANKRLANSDKKLTETSRSIKTSDSTLRNTNNILQGIGSTLGVTVAQLRKKTVEDSLALERSKNKYRRLSLAGGTSYDTKLGWSQGGITAMVGFRDYTLSRSPEGWKSQLWDYGFSMGGSFQTSGSTKKFVGTVGVGFVIYHTAVVNIGYTTENSAVFNFGVRLSVAGLEDFLNSRWQPNPYKKLKSIADKYPGTTKGERAAQRLKDWDTPKINKVKKSNNVSEKKD